MPFKTLRATRSLAIAAVLVAILANVGHEHAFLAADSIGERPYCAAGQRHFEGRTLVDRTEHAERCALCLYPVGHPFGPRSFLQAPRTAPLGAWLGRMPVRSRRPLTPIRDRAPPM